MVALGICNLFCNAVKAYLPSVNNALGLYIPLIVVNCIILGRAESYASKNRSAAAFFASAASFAFLAFSAFAAARSASKSPLFAAQSCP